MRRGKARTARTRGATRAGAGARRNGTVYDLKSMSVSALLREASGDLRAGKTINAQRRKDGLPPDTDFYESADRFARAALVKADTHAEAERARKLIGQIDAARHGRTGASSSASKVGKAAKKAGKAVASRSKQALRALSMVASDAWKGVKRVAKGNRKRNQSLEDLQGMLKMHQRRGDAEMTAYYKEAIAHAKKRSVSKRKKKPTKRSGKHRNRGRGSSQVGPSRASRTTRRSAGVHSARFWGN